MMMPPKLPPAGKKPGIVIEIGKPPAPGAKAPRLGPKPLAAPPSKPPKAPALPDGMNDLMAPPNAPMLPYKPQGKGKARPPIGR